MTVDGQRIAAFSDGAGQYVLREKKGTFSKVGTAYFVLDRIRSRWPISMAEAGRSIRLTGQ